MTIRLIFIYFTFFLHAEQNSSIHVGHLTATGDSVVTQSCCILDVLPDVSVELTEHTVSQPALGHQARFLSNSTSADNKIHVDFIFDS